MIRELQWLYRSCRALMPVVIGVGLYSHLASAQMIDPLSLPDPDGGILHPLVDRGCHGRLLREYGGAARDTFMGKIDGGPADTSTIVPGDRDFLEPNYPNPFGPTGAATTIAYALSEDSPVLLRIHDFFYNQVVTLVDMNQTKGRHVVSFLPSPTLSSGMYIYELKTNRIHELRRMLYVR
ncbi:MAG: hypothetical protein JWQ98_2984 [Chlorobi bacterium]|nr:hypothetical protein [Chlorobiota bacterium]